MYNLENIVKLAENEFDAIYKNGKFRSREEIDSVYKLIDIVKDINEIWCMEDEMDGNSYNDYNGNGYGRNGNRGYNRYDDGNMNGYSNYERRGRGRNASRDSRGRYNEGRYNDGNRINFDGSMTYRDGGKEEFMEEMRELMNNAPDEQTRQSIQRMMNQMG